MTFSKALPAIFFISLALRAGAIEASDLYGTWRLVGATTTLVTTGERSDAYGPAPTGFLSYGSDGRMSAIIAYSPRPKPADVVKTTDEERLKLYQTFLAYAGTFSLQGSTVTHHVDVSSNEVWTGSNQVRYFKFEGDTLVIRTDAMPRRSDNQLSIFELRWVRVKGGLMRVQIRRKRIVSGLKCIRRRTQRRSGRRFVLPGGNQMKALIRIRHLLLCGTIAAVVPLPLLGAADPVRFAADASAKYPPSADLRITRDIEYARYNETTRLLLDLYQPVRSDQPRLPLIVVIRGGGWRQTDKEGFAFIAAYLAHAGFATACMEYRSTAKATFPAPVQDAKAAVRWARANAARYGFDPDRIGAIGGSAGGHLAVLLATTADDPSLEGPGGNAGFSSRVAAVVAMSPDTDFRGEWADPEVAALLGPGLHEGDERLSRASPATHVTARAAPLLLIHSRTDTIVPYAQSLNLKARYEAAGVPLELITLEDAPHTFFLYSHWFPQAMNQAIDFLRRTFATAR